MKALFSIGGSSGVLAFITTKDYENPTDANTDGVYEVTVQVSDGNGGTDAQAISVTVTNVNEAPVITTPQLDSEEAVYIVSSLIPNEEGQTVIQSWMGVRYVAGAITGFLDLEQIGECTGLGRKVLPNPGNSVHTEALQRTLAESPACSSRCRGRSAYA